MHYVQNGSLVGLSVRVVTLAAVYGWLFVEICLLAKLDLKQKSRNKEPHWVPLDFHPDFLGRDG